MIEIKGDIWKFHRLGNFICIPTNGYVARDGHAVMGRGLAFECTKRYSGIQYEIGKQIKLYGNIPSPLSEYKLITFPTKHFFKDIADINLIIQSSQKLIDITDLLYLDKVYLPHVGCGNGNLKWEDVKKNIEPIFKNDDRFIFVDYIKTQS